MGDDKVKIGQIRAPMDGGRLMCEVERRTRGDRNASGDGDDEPTDGSAVSLKPLLSSYKKL